MKHNSFFLPNTVLPNITRKRASATIGRSLLGLTLIMLVAILLSNRAAYAQAYAEQTLHTFVGGTSDGKTPLSSLINVNGTLYGTTRYGGSNDTGTIFSINSNGSGYQTLYTFGSSSDGQEPWGTLTLVNGLLYGTTGNGGTASRGTIFSFDPASRTETLLYSFTSNSDGYYPTAQLIEINGTLYGSTYYGGANSKGIIFSFDPFSQTEKVLYSFGTTATEGANPQGDFINVNGLLYGATVSGGSPNLGTIFSFDPIAKTMHTLHQFTGTNLNGDGASSLSRLTNINGTLYGVTESGGTDDAGTIYSINANGSGYQTLYSFTNSVGDGAVPIAGMINLNGKLYGTTAGGGLKNSGTIFSFDPAAQAETTLYRFTATDSSGHNADGSELYAGLLNINGTLYGATEMGGTSGVGTLFSLTPVVLPTAKNDSGRGIANHTITVTAPGVLGNDNNGGDPKTTTAIVTNPTHGTLAFNSDGSFTYKPNTNFVGNDSFTYKDTNLVGTSNTATCTIAIGPIAYNDSGRTYFNTPVTINSPGVLANDTTGGIATTASLVTNPSHGTITFNSNGGFTYTPTNGFQGTDTFTYKITSAGGTSAPATCTMTVQARTPVANNDAGRVTHNNTLTITAPGVLGNDNPGTNTGVTAALMTNVSHGTLTFNSNGSFVYKPTTGFIGTDSFTYKDTNSVGTSNTATCTLTVQ